MDKKMNNQNNMDKDCCGGSKANNRTEFAQEYSLDVCKKSNKKNSKMDKANKSDC